MPVELSLPWLDYTTQTHNQQGTKMAWRDNKPDEVWAQVGNEPRWKVGITRLRPNERWYKEHNIDLKRIIKIEWSEVLRAWIIKLKPAK
jgi:hypothetical protein